MFRRSNSTIINQPVDQDDKGIFSSSKTFSGTLFFIGVLFIAIAALFFDEKCDNHAVYYLLFSGLLQTTTFIIRAFNKEENVLELSILGALSAAVLIWGSVMVLAAYPTWQYQHRDVPGFCPQLPYLAAFCYLVINLLVLGLVALAALILLGCLCAAKLVQR